MLKTKYDGKNYLLVTEDGYPLIGFMAEYIHVVVEKIKKIEGSPLNYFFTTYDGQEFDPCLEGFLTVMILEAYKKNNNDRLINLLNNRIHELRADYVSGF